ncbi:hypothetical protein DPMN_118679 [Dreissena polymorpha]|uniref:Uncharacterized protein n=1 Tax=Dreissena polymorpha TaxID=45954 RepID=A0A9D4GHF0_DREPO|nr:hypothetical protein DPMN_118679 [Dreissena polymorpha]
MAEADAYPHAACLTQGRPMEVLDYGVYLAIRSNQEVLDYGVYLAIRRSLTMQSGGPRCVPSNQEVLDYGVYLAIRRSQEVRGAIPSLGAFLQSSLIDTKYWFYPENETPEYYLHDGLECRDEHDGLECRTQIIWSQVKVMGMMGWSAVHRLLGPRSR